MPPVFRRAATAEPNTSGDREEHVESSGGAVSIARRRAEHAAMIKDLQSVDQSGLI